MNRRLLAALLMMGLGVSSPAHADDVAGLRRDVQTADDVRAEEAAKQLAASKDPRAVDAILDLLSLGIPPRHAQVLLAGLANRKDAKSIEVLVLFARNRNAELRTRAIGLLGGIVDPKTTPYLLAALSDESPEVRAEAAGALGRRREKSAESKLLVLLERRDPSAPAAIAELATPELVHRLAEKIGPIPDALLAETLGDILKRADFGPDPIRVEIVKTLAKIPGVDSTTALIEYVQSVTKDKGRPSVKAAQETIDQRSQS